MAWNQIARYLIRIKPGRRPHSRRGETVMKGKTYIFMSAPAMSLGSPTGWDWFSSTGEKPLFYLHHKIGFPSTLGDQSFFNVTICPSWYPSCAGPTKS